MPWIPELFTEPVPGGVLEKRERERMSAVPYFDGLMTDDMDALIGLEYNVVGWGRTELPLNAGIAVYVRREGGKLAAARVYHSADPPLPHA